MKIVITGSEGNIGRRLRRAFPDTVGIDIKPGAELRANLEFIDYDDPHIRRAFETADAVIHLATASDPEAPAGAHWQDVVNASRLFATCLRRGVKSLAVASSRWADPEDGREINAYGHSKRVLEIMTAMYDHETGMRGRSVRVGWVPHDPAERETAPEWLARSYWSDTKLVQAFQRAIGPPARPNPGDRTD